MALPEPRMTLQAFLELPEEKPALELIDGMVVRKVSPQQQHIVLQNEFAARVNAFARPRRLAMAFPELRGVYGPDSLVPDVAVVRWERLTRTERGRVANDPDVVPDIAVEILSPGQNLRDQLEKCRRYLDRGVRIVLHVDPRNDTIRRFEVGQPVQVLQGNDRVDLDAVLPGFALTVNELFATLDLEG